MGLFKTLYKHLWPPKTFGEFLDRVAAEGDAEVDVVVVESYVDGIPIEETRRFEFGSDNVLYSHTARTDKEEDYVSRLKQRGLQVRIFHGRINIPLYDDAFTFF